MGLTNLIFLAACSQTCGVFLSDNSHHIYLVDIKSSFVFTVE